MNAINRAPFDATTSEATYEFHVLTEAEHVGAVRDVVGAALEKASYPIRDIEVSERSDDVTELVATLVSTAVVPAELDAVAQEIEGSPFVSHASWSTNADD